jgi:predicted transcriptional regulator
MRTALSVPDDIFERAEQLARAQGRSRSELYAAALREYIARHAPDEATADIDQVVASVGDPHDPFTSHAARPVLADTEW